MRFFQSFIFVFLFVFLSGAVIGQHLREDEVVVIKGEKFVIHQVRTGETPYSVSQKFKVDRQTLIDHNPGIAGGLKIGDVLKIPYKEEADLQDEPVYKKGDPPRFDFHTITSRKQTPYFIAKEYGITVEELYAYNPEVKRFRKGTRLRIPRWDAPAEEEPSGRVTSREKLPDEGEGDELIRHEVSSGETLYSLSKKYNVSESEILFYNPGARDLKAGSIIYLPLTEEMAGKRDIAEERLMDMAEGKEKETKDLEEIVTEETGAEGEISSLTSNYFEHTIASGETLWSISRQYDVSEEELKKLNPVLESGFPAGVTLQIPVKAGELSTARPVNEEAFIPHRVEKGENLYRLALRYNMRISEIKKFNPALNNRNLVTGETIYIPRRPDKEIVEFMENKTADSLAAEPLQPESDYYEIEVQEPIPDHCRPVANHAYTSRVYDVSLFLPLFLQANDTLNRDSEMPDSLMVRGSLSPDTLLEQQFLVEKDTLIEREEPKEIFYRFFRDSKNFLQFYEGVLLAVDSLKKEGMNIRLNVYDTQQNPDSVRKIIHSDQFIRTDLIIGPVYPEVQDEVAAIAAKNRIPMVSPLASRSADLSANPWLYQINPSRDFLAVKTAELVAEEYFNSNFIVFKTGNSNYYGERVVEMAREKLFQSGYWGKNYGVDFNVYDFDNEGPFGFRRILSHEKENVVLIPSLNEGELSVALSNINNLADDYSITLIGFNRYDQFKSIDKDYFHNLKLHYIDPYWVDYEAPGTIRFVEKFRKHFYTEPDNFGIQGYDVAFYFLQALKNYGKDFQECLPYMRTGLVQGNYHFEKVSPFGGYMNHGVSVICYRRNYDVVRTRVIGQRHFAER